MQKKRKTSHRSVVPLPSGIVAAVILLIILAISVLVVQWRTRPGGSRAAAGTRARPRIVNNQVVAENGWPLRGENPRLYSSEKSSSAYWANLRDTFHLNTVRVLVYREPQGFSGGCGSACTNPDMLSATDADTNHDGQLTGEEKTRWDTFMAGQTRELDLWVDRAAQVGFYVIIDYHPVGGLDRFDARQWWTVVAPRYKDRSHVLYELANEPVAWAPDKYTQSDIAWEEDMYRYLRSVAPSTHIILWSFANASAGMKAVVDRAPGISYTNASVAFHIYGTSNSAIRELMAAYPVFASEMGGDTSSDYNGKVTYVEGIGVHSWILLDGNDPTKAVTVTWPRDPYFAAANTPQPTPTPSGGGLMGDSNRDRRVDALDYALLFESYGKRSGQAGFNPAADIAPSGQPDDVVNALDYAVLFENYGRSL